MASKNEGMGDRLFSEDEVQKIIKRAAELQKEDQDKKAVSERGLTMDELMKIGSESGLNMQHLKLAALEFSEQKVTRKSGFTDTHIFEERDIETSVDEQLIWDEVRSELRHNLGTGDMFGEIKEHPNQREWSHRSLSGIETIASLSSREDGVKLRISQRVGLASSLTEGVMYGGILSVVVFGLSLAALDPNVYQGTALFASLMVICSILVYTLDVAWRKKKLRRLSELVDKITGQLPNAGSKNKSGSENRIHIEEDGVYGAEQKDSNSESAGQKLGN